MNDDDKIIIFPTSVHNEQAEHDDYAAHRKQLIDELRNRHEFSAIKKTSEDHQGKGFDSELFRWEKSALQDLILWYFVKFLFFNSDFKSPICRDLHRSKFSIT